MDGFRDVLNVAGVEAGDANPAIRGQEYSVVVREGLAHLGRQPREGEHPDLPQHVRPVVLAPGLLQRVDKPRAHLPDPAGHLRAVGSVLIRQRRIGEHRLHNAASVPWRTTVHRTDNVLQHADDALLLYPVAADDRQCPDSFAVQAWQLSAESATMFQVCCIDEAHEDLACTVTYRNS